LGLRHALPWLTCRRLATLLRIALLSAWAGRFALTLSLLTLSLLTLSLLTLSLLTLSLLTLSLLTLSLLTLSLLTVSLLTLSLLTLSLLTLSLLTLSLLTLASLTLPALLAARSWLRLTISRSALTRVALTRLVRWVLAGRLPLVRRVLTGLAVTSAATFAGTVAVGLCLPRLHPIGRVVAGLPAVIENSLHRLAVVGPIGSHRRAGLLTPALLTSAFLVSHSALVAGLLPLG
jgi:deleted-in-malignant-brain-tumors protein 1